VKKQNEPAKSHFLPLLLSLTNVPTKVIDSLRKIKKDEAVQLQVITHFGKPQHHIQPTKMFCN